MQIVNFGSMNLDYIYAVPHLIRGGETLPVSGRTEAPGGKGLNQSIAAARSGASVRHAGMLGVGGEPLRACLAESGVDTSLLFPCDAPQGHTVIQVDPAGENCILVFGGSNRRLTGAHIDRALEGLEPGDWIMAQNECACLDKVLAAAARRRLRLALNASPIDGALLALDLSAAEWLVVNELECMALAGCDRLEEAARRLRARYPSAGLLLTVGEAGSVSWKDGTECRQRAFPVRAVDTTAAGDTYMGYFVGALAAGQDRRRAMELAARAAALAVTRPGAAPSIPWRAEVEAAALETGEGADQDPGADESESDRQR